MSTRRDFVSSFATVGAVGAAAMAFGTPNSAKADTPAAFGNGRGHAIEGPYLDLRTGKGNQLAFARMQGDLDFGKPKRGWYKGYVSAVRPDKKLEDLFGFEGFGAVKLEKMPDGSIRRILREVGLYTDLKSGDVLEEWYNPYIDERVRVVPVANDPFNYVIEENFPEPPKFGGLNTEKPPRVPFILPWQQRGGRLDMEIHIHLLYPNALKPEEWPRESSGKFVRVSEFFAHHVSAADMQNPKLTKLPMHGVWNRVTPWLPWMLMGQAAGHCQYACFMGSGEPLEEIFSRKVLDYIEKNFLKYLEPPAQWSDISLSSLENYAREQKPAPAKGATP
ncbi:MAG: DUF1838 family protein [Gammaproteobacteria bacterium]